jgi:YesN/AraC family two-component response regulator
MYKFEPIIQAFESACECKVTLHDPTHILYVGSEPLLAPMRSSHRQIFPQICGKEQRNYCVRHCMDEVNNYIERKRRKVFLKHCRGHFVEVVVPIYLNDRHVITFFAGIWQTPLPRRRIKQVMELLPVVAMGILQHTDAVKLASQYPPTVKEKINSFVTANYSQAISTRDLAKYLSLSVSRTCHLVQEHFESTFFDLLTTERIFHAKLFLRNTDFRINEIAGYCGFQNVENFNRTFKAKTGKPPGWFRK